MTESIATAAVRILRKAMQDSCDGCLSGLGFVPTHRNIHLDPDGAGGALCTVPLNIRRALEILERACERKVRLVDVAGGLIGHTTIPPCLVPPEVLAWGKTPSLAVHFVFQQDLSEIGQGNVWQYQEAVSVVIPGVFGGDAKPAYGINEYGVHGFSVDPR